MNRERISLAHPAFVAALALLLANDLVLKALWPGWITGKLSDVAGLFVLPYFLAWLWPSRRLALHVGVALAFVAWKLPLSRPFVELWNAAPWFDIARVEDLGDLIALASVVLAYRATAHASRRVVHLPSMALAFVALLAFTATSKRYEAPVRGTYFFAGTPAELAARLRAGEAYVGDDGDGHWTMSLCALAGDDDCPTGTMVDATVESFHAGTLVQLESFTGRREFKPRRYQAAIRDFNRIALAAGLDPGRPVAAVPADPGRVECPPSGGALQDLPDIE